MVELQGNVNLQVANNLPQHRLKMNIGLSKYESTSATCAITNTQCCQSVIRNVVYTFVVELISLKIPLLKRYSPPALYTLQEYVPTGWAALCSWRVVHCTSRLYM